MAEVDLKPRIFCAPDPTASPPCHILAALQRWKIICLPEHDLIMQQTSCFESEVLGFGISRAALYLFDLQESSS